MAEKPLNPGLSPSTHEHLVQAQQWQQQGAWLEAAAAYAAVAERLPADHRFLANQGNALWLADLPEAAHRCYSRALDLRPDCPISQRGLASCLRDLNQFDAALQVHRHLAQQLPLATAEGQANLWAHSQLLMGMEHFEEAYRLMAARRNLRLQPHSQPGNSPLLGGELTLVSEQGLGDTLQFVRFVPELLRQRQAAGLGGDDDGVAGVKLWVEPPLVKLLSEGLAWLNAPPTIQTKTPSVSVPSNALSLLNLPHALTMHQAWPPALSTTSPQMAYLRSALWSSQPRWLAQRHPPASGPAVGLVWAAGRKLDDPFCAREYHKRSLPARLLWQLVAGLQQQGACVYNLQFGPDQAQVQALGLDLHSPGLSLQGLAAAARVVAQLDLVITVDTAMAHLVGAMGRPGWVLLPWSADPRWLADTPATPWYPTLRLFRQPRGGDWQGAVDQLLAAFKADFHSYGCQ